MICYEDEFVVKVWMHGCGHASGLIRTVDTRYSIINPNNMTIVSTYISWWPGEDDYNKHSMPVGDFQKRTAGPKVSYFQDKYYETGSSTQERFKANPGNFVPRPNQAVVKYQSQSDETQSRDVVLTKPANIVNIPGIGTKAYYAHQKHDTYRARVYGPIEKEKLARGERALWGINLVEMAIWWHKFLTNPKNGYQYASTDSNCAGVIMGALIAGGASAFVTIKSVYIYRTPENVRDVVLALEIKLDKLNTESLVFFKSVDANMLYQMKLMNVEIYNLKEFKEASKSKKFGLRREQVSKMDDNLSTYKDCGVWTRDNYIKKLTSLVNIMENVISHRRDKPGSDRRFGVEKLGVQVINILRNDNSSLNNYLKRNKLAKENIGEWCELANENLYLRRQPNTEDPTRMKAKNR